MAGSDDILSGILGALEGFSSVYVPYKKAEFQDALAARRKKQELEEELNIYKQKLPIQTSEDVRKQGLELAQTQPYKLAQIQAEKPSDTVTGLEINAARPDLSLNPTQKFNKAVIPLFKPQETAEQKLQARATQKLRAEKPKAEGAYNNTIQGYDNLISQAQDILKDTSLGTATGITSFMGSVPATGAKRVSANLETIKAKTLLNVLTGLKQLSANGASGFGQLSNVEGETIKNSVANLDRSLGTADFKRNLITFINEAVKSRSNIQDTYQKTYGSLDGDTKSSVPVNSGGLTPEEQKFIQDYEAKHGKQ